MVATTLVRWCLVLFVVAGSIVAGETTNCNQTFHDCASTGDCFYAAVLDKLPRSLNLAEAECVRRYANGSLPALDTPTKNVQVAGAIRQHLACVFDRGFFWLGLQREEPNSPDDLTSEGWKNPKKWRWLGSGNGTLASYPFNESDPWTLGQPDGFGYNQPQDTERCVVVEWRRSNSNYVGWADYRCNLSSLEQDQLTGAILVCQVDPPTELSHGASSTTTHYYSSTNASDKGGRIIQPPTPVTHTEDWSWQWILIGTCAVVAVVGASTLVAALMIRRRRRLRDLSEQEQMGRRSDSDDSSGGKQRSYSSSRTPNSWSKWGSSWMDYHSDKSRYAKVWKSRKAIRSEKGKKISSSTSATRKASAKETMKAADEKWKRVAAAAE